MSRTPIRDFVRAYARSGEARLHMPGHKGVGPLGFEALDITEIDGADNLYAPEGIIARSEALAGELFGAKTLYSTEGSSLALRAMLFLAASRAAARGRSPVVLAARNAHRTFLTAAALLDLRVRWLTPQPGESYHACTVAPEALEAALTGGETPCAVYVTSPDYLGHVADVAALSSVCHRHGVPLLVDNAHGAYLKFLRPSRHPIDLGADLCCDSAHKTLPVLTGGAYLHVAPGDGFGFAERAREALALFGSTSPSYLILQSLDAANAALPDWPEALSALAGRVDALRERLTSRGWTLCGDEPLKLTLRARPAGYTGDELGEALAEHGVRCEFHDADYAVLMLSPMNPPEDLDRVEAALSALPLRPALEASPPPFSLPKAVLTPRQALFSPREALPLSRCADRVMAGLTASCPPAVPIVMCGEVIDEPAIERLAYYGVKSCLVVKEG